MAISEDVGSVVALWRFPVKSMAGEQLHSVEVTERGVSGDRAYALIDKDTGKVVSAKSVRLFPNLLDCKAVFVEQPRRGGDLPPVQILLPDGTTVPPRRRGRRPWGQQRHGCRGEARSGSFCRTWNGFTGSCRFFLRRVSPLGPDDVDARASRGDSTPEPLRPAQVSHERDREDGATWIGRERLDRSQARAW
jgi:MOSC N-terminal beta barrel domain